MKKFYEALNQIEAFTAGRYYGEEKKNLIGLIAQINNLSEEEKENITALCLDEEIEKLDTLQAVSNALVMLECKKNAEGARALLLARKKELARLEREDKWSSREEWLKYINSKMASADRCVEKAVFLYAKGEKARSLEIFKSFAEACHLFALQACRVICRELNDEAGEMRYLVILERVYDELLNLTFTEELKERMAELSALGYDNVREGIDVAIDYFDENGPFRMVFKA